MDPVKEYMGISFRKRTFKKNIKILVKKGLYQVFDHTSEEFKFATM